MNIPAITMSKHDARAKLVAYRAYLRSHANAEYAAAVAGYRALAKGTPLINLAEAMTAAGLGADGRPRLAIARADRSQVRIEAHPYNNEVEFSTRRYGYRSGPNMIVRIPFPRDQIAKMETGYALVPMIPADVRPHIDLSAAFVLWEVERWASRPLLAGADRDPYLLQPLIGDLYAVIAEWNLTELERAIMSARRTA